RIAAPISSSWRYVARRSAISGTAPCAGSSSAWAWFRGRMILRRFLEARVPDAARSILCGALSEERKRFKRVLFVLVAVLLLFLLFLVVVAISLIALVIDERVRIVVVLNGSFQRLALDGFALALTAPFVPGVEELLQPGEHLFDRRQQTGRAGLATRALRTGGSSRTARPGFALFALRSGLALRPSFARYSRLA